MIPEILTAALLTLGLLYIVMRVLGHFPRGEESAKVKATTSGKIYHSKTQDIAFFDGISEDYAEAMNRTKQLGGA